MSRMRSSISMLTGQMSSQARQVVHDHTSSGRIRWRTESPSMTIPAARLTGGATPAAAAATSPTFRTISRGSSGLPVMLAGHTDVHRPQIVQASVSNSCFQVKSATIEAPIVSMSSTSARFGISRMAPLARSAGRKEHVGRRGDHVSELGRRHDDQE